MNSVLAWIPDSRGARTPIRGSFRGAPVDSSGNVLAALIVLDGIAEVYAKGVSR